MAAQNTPAHYMIGASLAVVMGLSTWTLNSVQDLGELTAVQSNELMHLKESIARLSGDIYVRGRGERLEVQVKEVETRVNRLWSALNRIRGEPE